MGALSELFHFREVNAALLEMETESTELLRSGSGPDMEQMNNEIEL